MRAGGSRDTTPADQCEIAIPYSCRYGEAVDGIPRFRYVLPGMRTWLHTYEYYAQLRGEDEGRFERRRVQEWRTWEDYFPRRKVHYWDKQAQQKGVHRELTGGDVRVPRAVEVMCLQNEETPRSEPDRPPCWADQADFFDNVFSRLEFHGLKEAAEQNARDERVAREEEWMRARGEGRTPVSSHSAWSGHVHSRDSSLS